MRLSGIEISDGALSDFICRKERRKNTFGRATAKAANLHGMIEALAAVKEKTS
jgi:hypothetical protein